VVAGPLAAGCVVVAIWMLEQVITAAALATIVRI